MRDQAANRESRFESVDQDLSHKRLKKPKAKHLSEAMVEMHKKERNSSRKGFQVIIVNIS